ncbi:MAG: CHASE domain-containing protein, partial [Pseudomonadota bacterium]|nr:CHASE domain-containing protein [Pseudomonadota bacterium]MDQ3160391.1 CHASE domain-containing protein [Pseudomonadota bacterium]
MANSEKRRGELDAHRVFVSETKQVASDIQGQLDRCEQIIRAFQSIFMASERVTPDEYALAYENMNDESVRRVSLQALAYAERQPSPRGDRYITTMFAPEEKNSAILGLDVGSQPNNMEALRRARDSNKIAMSAPFVLRQSKPGQLGRDGFILRLPVYARGVTPDSVDVRRASSIGSVGASFRIAELIASTLSQAPTAIADLTVEDISTGSQPRTLYSSRFAGRAGQPP